MSRKLNEIKNSLNFQIQGAIGSAITAKLLPSIQNRLEMQGRCHDPLPVVGVNGVLHLDVEEVAVTASIIKLNCSKLM